MAASLSSNVNSKYEGPDFYATMALFCLKGMTDITVVNHSPFLYRNNHKMSFTASCRDHFSRVLHLNTCMRFTNTTMFLYFTLDGLFLFFRANRPCKTTSESLSPLLMTTSSAAVLQFSPKRTDFQIRDLLTDSTTLWWFRSENKQGCANKNAKWMNKNAEKSSNGQIKKWEQL